jgi:hypothetical protein
VGTGPTRPEGVLTRGTTNPNRLRRCDRWLAGPQAWRIRRAGERPLVVDLGYGASAVTTVELAERLQAVRADVEVVGVEIDPARVAAAIPLERPGLRFVHGGFEIPLERGRRPTVVRAFNVLRQYDETQVRPAWTMMMSRLAADGIVVEGTCDELGRLATWVTLTPDGPTSLTVSMRLRGLTDPVEIAERLPKTLIHRNVPGEPVHAWLTDLTDAWLRAAPMGSFGVRQRFVAAAASLRDRGWSLLDGPQRWRLGEITIAWADIAPSGMALTGEDPAQRV